MANGELSFLGAGLNPTGTTASLSDRGDDLSARLVEMLLSSLETGTPTPPAKIGRVQQIIGSLGDALKASAAARLGQPSQGLGPFASQLRQRQAEFEKKQSAFEQQRIQTMEALAKMEETKQQREIMNEFRRSEQGRQASLDEYRRGQDIIRLDIQKQGLEIRERGAQTAEERLAIQQRLGELNAEMRALGLNIQQDRLDLAKQTQLGAPRAPGAIQGERLDIQELLSAVREAKDLVSKGVGGPVAGRFAFMSPDSAKLRTLFAEINTLVGPNRLGATIPAGEREIIAGLLSSETGTNTSQRTALDYIERAFGVRLQRIESEYQFGPRGEAPAPSATGGVTVEVGPDGKLRISP